MVSVLLFHMALKIMNFNLTNNHEKEMSSFIYKKPK